MSIWETLRTSLGAILSNKLRTALTMLGIIIGVAAVIALSGLGEGVSSSITDQIESIGSNIIMITARPVEGSSRPAELTNEDADALTGSFAAPSLSAVAPEVSFQATVSRGSVSDTYSVLGSNESLDDIMSLEPAMGGFLTANDLDTDARVAVLGWDVYVDLFGEGTYPIQQYITIDGARYSVVGVAEQEGGMMGTDSNIWIPLTTAQSRHFTRKSLSGEHLLSMILAQTADSGQADQAQAEITAVLRKEHRLSGDDENDFHITAQEDILDMASQITGTLTLFLGAIAGISLVVGGIGIMNIMLVTVTERTREIGIRKAIGAPPVAIMTQFMIEALVLTLLGGIIGMVFGSWVATLVGGMLGVTARITPSVLLLAAGVSALVGLVFGTYPAVRAARLNPIEALRYE